MLNDLPQDSYVIAITALLPLTSIMLVSQVNPYHALVIRGILGAVAALVYALFGAADVALTEALVGTMLSITLYAVAVRSSMSMRVGMLADNSDPMPKIEPLVLALRQALSSYHLRIEVVLYGDERSLRAGLQNKAIHAICLPDPPTPAQASPAPYHLQLRLRRLYDILQSKLPPEAATLSYSSLTQSTAVQPPVGLSHPVEGQS
jgi:putative multicomponent Na+:H+ antiporter subunit B